MAIRKRKDRPGAWLADYTDGTGKRHVRTFKREQDAQAFMRRRDSIPVRAHRIDPLVALLSTDELLALPSAWAGIYFLIFEGAIQYVGQSSDVHARIKDHVRGKRIKFDRAVWIECDVTDFDYLEAAYIKQCKPPLNRGIRRNS
jgi:GIY-YIG catalytic domain